MFFLMDSINHPTLSCAVDKSISLPCICLLLLEDDDEFWSFCRHVLRQEQDQETIKDVLKSGLGDLFHQTPGQQRPPELPFGSHESTTTLEVMGLRPQGLSWGEMYILVMMS